MTNLEEFWANNNSVEDFKEVKGFYDFILIEIVILVSKVSKLTPNSSLLTVYLEHNPIQVRNMGNILVSLGIFAQVQHIGLGWGESFLVE